MSTTITLAQEGAQQGSIDQTLQNVFGPIVDALEAFVFSAIPIGEANVPIVVIWLLAAGVFLTVYLRVRPFGDAVQTGRVIKGQLTRRSDPGEVSSFQALATELSGTIGLGNIAGVAVAITIGGPGAALWIIIAGLLGMAVKLAEATLSQMFRRVDENGKVSGGPMYYLKDGLASTGRPKLGSALAFVYAFCFMFAALGAGNIFQSNQLAAHIVDTTGGEASIFAGRTWLIGVALAVVTGFVIIGGIKSIAKWTSRLVPCMSAIYAVSVIIILSVNFTAIPGAFKLIVTGAFNPEGVAGGIIGVAIIGIQRALFSNVAGVGTAGLAHSVSKNRRPTEEGLVAAWEPFIDSVIVCTMTALAIIVTGQYLNTDADGVVLTTNAFATVHEYFPLLLSICIVLFAFSTILSYSYYGQKAAGYLFKGNAKAEWGYNILYLVMIIVGSAVSLDTVVRFSDAMFFLVAIPNLLGIYLLAGPLKREIEGYREDARCGRIKIVDKEDRAPLLGGSTTPS
ncbi:alanine/glycine:cation symporter family protein [Corynebacterium testudinoris]|uniref:Amino acid carrier protein n=1 Tax=Corynebacterium testudinoris TaxID=136857 RepID=A0A0G3HAU2_9CORY|nr:alanine/glycine:cation symporter family protein [Corynebacterium testudinoris]AKK08262.1 amino acid carrier protein [Corynebacterium testudinoris]